MKSEFGLGGTASTGASPPGPPPPPPGPPPPPPPGIDLQEEDCASVFSSIDVGVPNDTENGDTMIMFVAASDNNVGNTPSGWTSLGSQLNNGIGLSTKAYRRVANNEPGEYTVDGFTSGQARCVAIITVENIQQSNPVDGFSSRANTTPSTNITASAINTTVQDTVVLFFAALPDEFAGSVNFTSSGSNPTFTRIIDDDTLGPNLSVGVGKGTRSGIGSTGDRDATWGGGDAVISNGHLLALKVAN